MPSWAPGVYRPTTATHQLWNLLSSLINGRDVTLSLSCRCPDFLSCLSPSVFSCSFSLWLSLSLSFSLFQALHLFQGLPRQLHEMLHSPFFLSVIHHSLLLLRPVVHQRLNPQATADTSSHLLPPGTNPFILIPPYYCSSETSQTQHNFLLNGSACAKVLLLSRLMQTLLKWSNFIIYYKPL